ncbi:MAG: glycoside hydrolase family 97 C-terminal domain-containing protein, partial [Clostridia bacterium]|nr:glycoside hydrolase family 97 C-terminal domain-containing protein [Clostridia bacterium]
VPNRRNAFYHFNGRTVENLINRTHVHKKRRIHAHHRRYFHGARTRRCKIRRPAQISCKKFSGEISRIKILVEIIYHSEIGSFAVFAKENKGTWFLGGIASKKQKGEEIHLDEFLGDGGYFMEMWVDTQDGTMERSDRVVTADDVLRFDEIAAGGGFVCRFSKVRLSQYGGAITGEPITAESVGESTVKYTTDGSDPSSSNTASVYSGEIKLRESCLLRIAVTEGDGQGTELSYRYNYITERISLSDETQSIGNYDFERFTSDSESVGFTVHVNDGATLKSVSVYGQKFSAENASLNMKIFKWNSEYESSVSAAPMFAGKAEIIKTGVPIYMDLGEGMPGGDYLIVIGPSEGSLNCGIQTRAAREESHVGETFVNGVRTDIGIKGSIDIAWPNGYPVNEPERQRFVDLFTAHAGSSMGERHSAYNLAQTGETVATMFAVLDGEKLKKIVVTIPSWFDDKGTITFKVFKWNENYFSTVGNDPVKEQVFDGYRDNSVVTIFFENGLQAGDYLFVACDAHDSKSSGVGIYLNVAGTDKRFKGTFINGKPDLNRAMECSLTLVDCN